MSNRNNTTELYGTRAEAMRAVDRWIARGYVASGYVYNPEYAEQEGHPNSPHCCVILENYPNHVDENSETNALQTDYND